MFLNYKQYLALPKIIDINLNQHQYWIKLESWMNEINKKSEFKQNTSL